MEKITNYTHFLMKNLTLELFMDFSLLCFFIAFAIIMFSILKKLKTVEEHMVGAIASIDPLLKDIGNVNTVFSKEMKIENNDELIKDMLMSGESSSSISVKLSVPKDKVELIKSISGTVNAVV